MSKVVRRSCVAFALALTTIAAASPGLALAGSAPYEVVPRAKCQPGDKPDTGLQGQIPLADRASGRSQQGYHCNATLIGALPARTFASFDSYQHCAYLPDETWAGAGTQSLGLSQAIGVGGAGIRVVDMSDTTHPRQTALLTSPIALAPDEAMAVNARRGLLVMNSTFDSKIDIYDIKADCEHPKFLGTFDMAPAQGHAGWFSPDGNTYWMTSLLNPLSRNIFPIDVSDPTHPKLMAQYTTDPGTGGHNGWTSDDGKTTYACQISLLDTSQNKILVFKSPTPSDSKQELINSFPLEGAVCQDMKAVSYGGRPYLIGNSEYTAGRPEQKGPSPCGVVPSKTDFSAPEIFDIADPRSPRIVSNLMLEVDDPKNCLATINDRDPLSGSSIPGEVYDTHFCRPDRLHDPTILACERFLSGLEVYDIRDPYHPKELAYYRTGSLGEESNKHPDWGTTPQTIDDSFAPPIVHAESGEIWFTNYFTGLKVVKLPKSVYPFKNSLTCENDWYFNQYNPGLCPAAAPSARDCITSKAVTLDVRGIDGDRVRSLTAYVNGKRVRVQKGSKASIRVALAGVRSPLATVRVVALLKGGKKVVDQRSYRLCRGSSAAEARASAPKGRPVSAASQSQPPAAAGSAASAVTPAALAPQAGGGAYATSLANIRQLAAAHPLSFCVLLATSLARAAEPVGGNE